MDILCKEMITYVSNKIVRGRYKGRGSPKKVWIYCVKDDMHRKEVNSDIKANREGS